MGKRKTRDGFIKEANDVHGTKYDYSLVEYVNNHTKVCIICPIHGNFMQSPREHLNGHGCPMCSGRKLDRELFIQKSISVHGDKYNYSKVEYRGNKEKVCIVCPIHGEFWQSPNNHMRGHGCPMCQGMNKTTEDFISEARKVHGDLYDYSKSTYIGSDKKICIICPIHGEFWQRAIEHLNGRGCRLCNQILTTDNFIRKAKLVHGDKYDYSKTEYTNNNTKVLITCPIHGDFLQNAGDHLSGKGCSKCGFEKNRKHFSDTLEDFVEKAKKVHGDRYDYSKVSYVNSQIKVKIGCAKHGEFLQTPNNHLSGSGCPLCYQSKGENAVKLFLDKQSIPYISQYKITNELALFWNAETFRVDFYLPEQNKIIEFNGKQHYEEVKCFHKEGSEFEKQKIRDEKLRKWCKSNKVSLLEIKYDQINNIEEILSNHINIDKNEKN